MESDNTKEKLWRNSDANKYKHKFGRIRIGQYGLGKRGYGHDLDQNFFKDAKFY